MASASNANHPISEKHSAAVLFPQPIHPVKPINGKTAPSPAREKRSVE
jgi:hypothetical protein